MKSSSKQQYQAFKKDRAAGTTDEAAQSRKPGGHGQYLKKYYRWLKPFHATLFGIFLLASVSAGLIMILPLASRHVVDEIILKSRDLAALSAFGFAMVGIILVQQIVDVTRHWWLAVANNRVIHQLRQRLFDHFLHLPLDDLNDLKTGGIVSRLSGDCDQVMRLLQMALVTPAVAALRVVMTVAVLFFLSWHMAVAAILFLPPIVAINLVWVRKIRPIYRSMRKDRARIDSRVVETFGGIRTVRAFGREKSESLGYALGHHTVIRKRLLARALELVVISGWGLVIPLVSVVIIWYGGYLHITSGLSIGSIMAFQMFVIMLLQPVSQIVNAYGQTQQGLAALERIFDILEKTPDMPDPPDAVDAPERVEDIVFDNVSFSYRPDLPVLKEVSLTVAAGTTIALVGPSGAGKTTITNLVARFYDPTEGAIRLNGLDLKTIRLKSYRSLLGLVQQDVFLFDGTITENIAFGRPGVGQDAIVDAAHRANAHDFIIAFPDAYDTLIGERGVKLSGGQAQRISIARALLADPQILILDEATSNLDSESESLIQDALEELITHRTTFIIAHRLSTITHADLIAVFLDGEVVETGTHESLMAREGLYREMVARQMDQVGMGGMNPAG